MNLWEYGVFVERILKIFIKYCVFFLNVCVIGKVNFVLGNVVVIIVRMKILM